MQSVTRDVFIVLMSFIYPFRSYFVGPEGKSLRELCGVGEFRVVSFFNKSFKSVKDFSEHFRRKLKDFWTSLSKH